MTKAKGAEELVLDLSGWNEAESYAAIKVSGVNHVVLKAINKSLKVDKKFEQHLKGCVEADIKVIGTYHYSYALTTEAARQAAGAWIRIVNGRCNLFILDWEDTGLPKDSKAIEIINTYADEIYKAGYQFAVYTGLSWYDSYLKKYADKLPYEFWIARYYAGYKGFSIDTSVNKKYMPAIRHELIGWQYTSSGNVPGIKGSVDMSRWYKSLLTTGGSSSKIPVDCNLYSEPTVLVRLGSCGEGTRWVQWYLWRFGLIDKAEIDGKFGAKTSAAVKESQKRLGVTPDGIVGKITRSLYRKIC